MFKKKQQSSLYTECLGYFNSKNAYIETREGYENFKTLYSAIRERYRGKIENGDIELNVEKARLKNEKMRSGWSMQLSTKYFFITLISVIISVYLQSINFIDISANIGNTSLGKLLDFLFKGFIIAAILCYADYLIFNKKRKENLRDNILINIKLIVLEELQMEKLEEKIEAERYIAEQKEYFVEGQVEKNAAKVGIVTDILMPAALEVAASMLKKDGIIRKLFRRIRK